MEVNILEMKNISKSFGDVKVLTDVSITVKKGTVHALIGENGAGKSTLMKCLFGINNIDSGHIYFDGKKVHFHGPDDALRHGIAMVQQELQLIKERSLSENIYCGRYPIKKFLFFKYIDDKKLYEDTKICLEKVGLDNDPNELLGTLSISKMQLVEIAKAISIKTKLIILDEPTSSLTGTEVQRLFDIIKKLKEKGVSFIYISHKIEEILEISDEVSILCDGKNVGTYESKDLTNDFIIEQMVGRELKERYPAKKGNVGEEILRIENFTQSDEKGFKDINFTVRKGEIFGIGGLVGAKRTELVESIFGLRNLKTGKIFYKGKEIKNNNAMDAIKNGFAYVTEDRKNSGIFEVLSISDNATIISLKKFLSKIKFLDNKKIRKVVSNSIEKFEIKTETNQKLLKYLSGGNQQKVVVAKWLIDEPKILILDEPTRGIDVGAKYDIYCIMREFVQAGNAIILISGEMPELIGMSDRIMVMCEGKVKKILNHDEATKEKIMEYATMFETKK